jgi:uracil phosphoribosyltransferase
MATMTATAPVSPLAEREAKPFVSGMFEVNHPLVASHLTRLRDRSTEPTEFRALVSRLASLLAYEALKDLQTEPVEVETPVALAAGCRLSQRIAIVPILRAGLGMVEPVLDLVPQAEVWHLGLYRDEATAQPVEYYCKLPADGPADVALVLDPMLATGGSAVAAMSALDHWGVSQIKLIALIASEEGCKLVETEFPNAQVYVCHIDADLNDKKYIVPGLGDAGDRIFNTVRHS